MHIWINKAAANYKAQKIGLAAAILVASVGAVVADERFPPNRDYGPYEHNGHFVKPIPGSMAPSRMDRNEFFRSGTRGRLGLGGSPIHPEGPGNVSD
jgi:hypothetical protein